MTSAVIPNNTRTPLNKLNDDVLCELFEIMSKIDPPRPRTNEIIGPGEVRFRLGWIHLTHVQRRWRRLLLSRRSLWAKVFSVMPESALDETMLRAGDALWEIHLDYNPYSQRYKKLMALESVEAAHALRYSKTKEYRERHST